jgi:hypothetical protein
MTLCSFLDQIPRHSCQSDLRNILSVGCLYLAQVYISRHFLFISFPTWFLLASHFNPQWRGAIMQPAMDTPGSELSSDSSDSSSVDSVSAESTPAQTVTTNELQNNPAYSNSTVLDQDDSDSDISMSADTEDEDDQAPIPSTIQVNHIGRILEEPGPVSPADLPPEGSNKRKYQPSTEDTINGHISGGCPEGIRKRLRPDDSVQNHRTLEGHLREDKSLLPAEIWHNIFTFIPPRNLGLLLRVNKCFNAYLDPSSSQPPIPPLSRSASQILNPDAIWRASRRFFQPGMPAPLIGKSELDMWKLACSFSCQFCSKKQQSNPPPPIDQWHPGPGENGVIPIWCFGIRTCGSCLQQRSSKVGRDPTN